MKKEKKISFGVIVSTILLVGGLLFLVIVNFDLLQNKTPNELYTVYLSGNKIGTVKSGDEFNNYINLQEEKLKEIRRFAEKAEKHFGLYSVNHRLLLYYGENSGLQIESKYEESTCITIEIPRGNKLDKNYDCR